MGTGIAVKRDITRTVYRANVCEYENGGTPLKSPAVFNTGTDFPNRPLFSNRDNMARIMCTFVFATTFCSSECLDLFLD